MDLLNADVQRRSVPILIRLTPDLHRRLKDVAESVGGGIATTCRAILETALREGINVVKSTDDMRPQRRARGLPPARDDRASA